MLSCSDTSLKVVRTNGHSRGRHKSGAGAFTAPNEKGKYRADAGGGHCNGHRGVQTAGSGASAAVVWHQAAPAASPGRRMATNPSAWLSIQVGLFGSRPVSSRNSGAFT